MRWTLALSLLGGCLGADLDVGNLPTQGEEESGESGSQGTAEAEAETETEGDVATVHVHVRANDTTYTHSDGFSGQDPREQFMGFRSLELMLDRNDAQPVLIFDHGTDFVEASFSPGADTVVGSAPVSSLPSQSFGYARVTVSHMRLTIDATMHAMGLDLPGSFEISHALGDEVELEGETRDKGWWRYVFDAGVQSFPLEGSDGGPPTGAAPGALIEVVSEGNETALYFPVTLVTDPGVAQDVHIVMDFNVDASFRWADEMTAEFTDGVFDSTPTSTEMIWRVGANDYEVYNEN